jgi:hypothetical protein
MPNTLCICGVLVQVVEHHLGHFPAAQLDHHPHAVLVGLVAQLGDAFELLLLDQLGDLFQQAGLVHLVGQLGHHQSLLAVALVGLHVAAGAHVDAPPARVIGVVMPCAAVDHAGGRKIGARQM